MKQGFGGPVTNLQVKGTADIATTQTEIKSKLQADKSFDGVIALSGLGSYERGLVGDLGLLKLCKALHGRWVEAEETAELLARYGEWQGLASVYLLSGFGRGLIPLPASTRRVRVPAAA